MGMHFKRGARALTETVPRVRQCCPLEELGRLLRETSLYVVLSNGTFIPLVGRDTHRDYGLVEPETKEGTLKNLRMQCARSRPLTPLNRELHEGKVTTAC